MRLLKNLLIEKSSDLSKLPKDVMQAIQKNIRKGAEDLKQKWANALELTHRAYEVEGVQRPNPSLKSAWEQYEQNLLYSVQQLADNRGMSGSWRMSSSTFHEAYEQALKQHDKFKITLYNKGKTENFLVETDNIHSIISDIKEGTDLDVNVIQKNPLETRLRFSQWGIRRNLRVDIEKY